MTIADPAPPDAPAEAAFADAIRRAGEGLSPAAAAFLGFVRDHPRLLRRDAFRDLLDGVFATVGAVSGVAPEVAAPVQPWPVLIDGERRRRFERLAVGLARLVRSLPRRIFAGDARRIAEFYGLDPNLAALLLAEPSGIDETLCRGDFVDGERGFQCIELNVGALGGWQHAAFAPLHLGHPEIARFARERGLRLGVTDSIRALFEHVVGAAAGDPERPGGRPLRVLVVASDGRGTSIDTHPLPAYRRALAAVAAAAGVEAEVEVARLSDLRFSESGVEVGGRRFDAAVEQNDIAPSEELFRAFKAGRVKLFTGSIGLITGDKRNLALLSRLQDSDLFDAAERELIRSAVPWTRDVTAGLAARGGRKEPMPDLLRRERETLVLKAADSYGGADVHIGRHTEPAAWAQLVERALAEGGWVVQEYLPPRPQAFQAGEEGWAWHDLVWGLYAFGDRYAGTFVRLAPRGGGGVVNIGRGATIGVALEAEPAG